MRVTQSTASIVQQCYPEILALCDNADLVVVSHNFAGRTEAEKLGLPFASVTLQHQSIPTSNPAQGRLYKTAASFMGAFITPASLGPQNQLRKKAGLKAVKGIEELMSPVMNLLPVSPSIVAADPRWKPQHKISGYWFIDEPAGWQPPDDLMNFLEAGKPPIAISLGEMALEGDKRAVESAQMILDAVQEAGIRAIIQGWDTVLPQLSLPKDVFHSGSLPHNWLFERVKAVVHHGGFGTTAAGLRAGRPAVVLPHVIEQYFWGERVYELGAGSQPVPRDKWSVPLIASAFTQVVEDDQLSTQAEELGKRIRQECGIQTAVKMIEDEWGK
jgi:sterol 3beta-glucosyltransferase